MIRRILAMPLAYGGGGRQTIAQQLLQRCDRGLARGKRNRSDRWQLGLQSIGS
jgi:hypothetical protein